MVHVAETFLFSFSFLSYNQFYQFSFGFYDILKLWILQHWGAEYFLENDVFLSAAPPVPNTQYCISRALLDSGNGHTLRVGCWNCVTWSSDRSGSKVPFMINICQISQLISIFGRMRRTKFWRPMSGLITNGTMSCSSGTRRSLVELICWGYLAIKSGFPT